MNNKTNQDRVDLYAVDGDFMQEAGVVTYFRFSGEVTEIELSDAADDHDLDEKLLPDLPSESTAMTRACYELKSKHVLVRAHEDGGYCVINENVDGEDIDFDIECRVKLDDKTLIIEPADHANADQIKASFRAHQNKYSTTDISKWLVKQLRRLDAVVLRDQGGVYFVPRTSVEEFEKIANVIRDCSKHRIFELPALQADETVEAVLDALTSEAESAAEQMETELLADAKETADKKALGKRALGTRLDRLDGLKKKLAKYEQLLGVNLDKVEERLERVRANVALAKIAIETEQDAAAV